MRISAMLRIQTKNEEQNGLHAVEQKRHGTIDPYLSV
jgi:hypothetical protein